MDGNVHDDNGIVQDSDKTNLCRWGRGGLRHRGEGETPLVGALHQQLAGCLLQIPLWPGLRDCVQVTGQAAAPLAVYGASHEGNTGFLHATSNISTP